MKKTLRYNYRLNPTPEQEVKLFEFDADIREAFGIYCYLKTCVDMSMIKRFCFTKTWPQLLKEIKTFEEFNWIKAFDSAAARSAELLAT